jgi:putative transposase
MTSYKRKKVLNSGFEPKQHHLPGYDYSKPGIYHVVIHCRRLAPPLSDIDPLTVQVMLFPEGECVCEAIQKVPTYFPVVEIDCYAIMPDHLHVLFIIGEQPQPPSGRERIMLGRIIDQLKGRATKCIRAIGALDFSWQRDFYDVIIWDRPQYENVRQYIYDNPRHWLEEQAE